MRTMRVMEAKLCAALCALLLINLGAADYGRKTISSLEKIVIRLFFKSWI